MIKRKITVTITDDLSENPRSIDIDTHQDDCVGYAMAEILEDIADRMMNEGRYMIRSRMDDLPESDQPY